MTKKITKKKRPKKKVKAPENKALKPNNVSNKYGAWVHDPVRRQEKKGATK